jgi:hypothetical protein
MLSEFALWLKSALEQIASWLLNAFLSIIGWLFDGLLYLLDLIGLADQIKTSSGYFDSLPEGAWYYLNLFQAQYGLSAILVAYSIRFLIRRIPGFG